jgi:hypothetical protein
VHNGVAGAYGVSFATGDTVGTLLPAVRVACRVSSVVRMPCGVVRCVPFPISRSCIAGVHLNPETGVLSFSCNGRNYGTRSLAQFFVRSLTHTTHDTRHTTHDTTHTGPAYLSLPVSKRLFLAVSLYHHSDQVPNSTPH